MKTLLSGLTAVALCITLVACDEIVVETDTQANESSVSVQLDAGTNAAPAASLATDAGMPSCSGSSCSMTDLAADATCSDKAESCDASKSCDAKADCDSKADCAEICPTECEPEGCKTDKPADKVQD